MQYEWDPDKAYTNQRKHRIDFADAVTVFTDDQAVTLPDDEYDNEERYVTIGVDALGRMLVVVLLGVGTAFGLFRHARRHIVSK